MALDIGNISKNETAFTSNSVVKSKQDQISKSVSVSQFSQTGLTDQTTNGAIYCKGNNVFPKTYTADGTMEGVKTKTNASKSKYSAEEILSEIDKYASTNDAYVIWHSGNTHWLQGTKNGEACGGKKFFDLEELQAALGKGSKKTVSVRNSSIILENNSYYMFIGKDGKEHTVLSLGGALHAGLFDNSPYDKEEADYVDFWNYLNKKEPSGLNMKFSNEEIRERLADAGVENGFFTVTIGDRSATHFISQGKNTTAVHSKEQYDNRYNMMTNGEFFKQFEAGHKVVIGGKEYTLNEDKKLDIEYGEDIFDMQLKSEA